MNLALMLAATTLAAPIPKDLAPNEQQKLVGSWMIVSQGNGPPAPPAPGTSPQIWTFVDSTTAKLSNFPDKTIEYSINPKTREFVWKPSWGVYTGVYELTKDSFKIAVCGKGGTPPTVCAPGQGHEFYHFQRVKK